MDTINTVDTNLIVLKLQELRLNDLQGDLKNMEAVILTIGFRYLTAVKTTFNILPEKNQFLDVIADLISKQISSGNIESLINTEIDKILATKPFYVKIFGSIIKGVVSVAIPVFQKTIIRQLLNQVDTSIVSKTLDENWYTNLANSVNDVKVG